MFAGLGGTLLLASGVGALLRQRFHAVIPPETLTNLNARIRAWWVMIALFGLCLWSGRLAFTAACAVVSALALREYFRVTLGDRGADAARLACFAVFLPAQYALVALHADPLFTVLIPIVALPAMGLLATDRRGSLERAATQSLGLLICVYGISCVPALLLLEIPGYEGRNALLVVFLVLVVQGSDVLQYLCGKLFGRRPIAPLLSPSKTVEGFAGGVLLATTLGGVLWRITPFGPGAALAMALAIALAGFLGGLVLSAIKRRRGVKDWGNLIAGHGGVLDRLDSVCLSAPLFLYLTRWLFAA